MLYSELNNSHYYSSTGELIAMDWRANVTDEMQKGLFGRRMAYNMICLDRRIDNTDERVVSSFEFVRPVRIL